MPRQNFYGDTLRNARERKGMDLATAARRLRIRADILQAIEDGDFSRMPPRGYTRNMVNAYARLVGVNPSEVTERYMDAAYQHETGRLPSSRESEGSASRRSRYDRDDGYRRGEAGSSRSGSRRRMTDRGSYGQSSGRSQDAGSRFSSGRGMSSSYPSMYSDNRPSLQLAPHLPLIIIGVIIIVLLVVVLVMVLSPKETTDQETPAVPITGLTDPTSDNENGGSGDQNNANENSAADAFSTATAPTSVVFSYSIADGAEAYVEIKLGDSGVFETSGILTGPVSKTYTLDAENPTLSFVTTSPQNVTLRLDDEKVEPEELTRQPGVYGYEVDFDAILRAWEADHPGSSSDDSGNDNSNSSADGSSNSNTSN